MLKNNLNKTMELEAFLFPMKNILRTHMILKKVFLLNKKALVGVGFQQCWDY